MAFKPNYNARRAERQRAQQEKHEEKVQARQDKAAKRRAGREDASPVEGESENK
jgi:hypothetical protein